MRLQVGRRRPGWRWLEDYNGGLGPIRAQVDVGAVEWDMVELEIGDAVLAR